MATDVATCGRALSAIDFARVRLRGGSETGNPHARFLAEPIALHCNELDLLGEFDTHGICQLFRQSFSPSNGMTAASCVISGLIAPVAERCTGARAAVPWREDLSALQYLPPLPGRPSPRLPIPEHESHLAMLPVVHRVHGVAACPLLPLLHASCPIWIAHGHLRECTGTGWSADPS